MARPALANSYRLVRRFVVFAVGLSVVAVGSAMILLPGPALLVIPAGLAILALEFEWARRLLRRVREETAELWMSQPRADDLRDGAARPGSSEHSRERPAETPRAATSRTPRNEP